MRTVGLVLLVAALVLVIPSAGHAAVRLVSLTSPVSPGKRATLTAAVSPAATCSITVRYKSGPSRGRGLSPKRSVNGRVSWSWTVGTNTTRGRWPVTVSCGAAGTPATSFVVR